MTGPGYTFTSRQLPSVPPELAGADLAFVGVSVDDRGFATVNALKDVTKAISSFRFGEEPLSRSRPATLRWEGGPLEKGETLVLMWENRALGQTVPMEIIRSGGDASLDFPAAKIAELPAGQWTLYLVRKRLAKTEAPGMRAEAVLEYYSKSDTIEVQ